MNIATHSPLPCSARSQQSPKRPASASAAEQTGRESQPERAVTPMTPLRSSSPSTRLRKPWRLTRPRPDDPAGLRKSRRHLENRLTAPETYHDATVGSLPCIASPTTAGSPQLPFTTRSTPRPVAGQRPSSTSGPSAAGKANGNARWGAPGTPTSGRQAAIVPRVSEFVSEIDHSERVV